MRHQLLLALTLNGIQPLVQRSILSLLATFLADGTIGVDRSDSRQRALGIKPIRRPLLLLRGVLKGQSNPGALAAFLDRLRCRLVIGLALRHSRNVGLRPCTRCGVMSLRRQRGLLPLLKERFRHLAPLLRVAMHRAQDRPLLLRLARRPNTLRLAILHLAGRLSRHSLRDSLTQLRVQAVELQLHALTSRSRSRSPSRPGAQAVELQLHALCRAGHSRHQERLHRPA